MWDEGSFSTSSFDPESWLFGEQVAVQPMPGGAGTPWARAVPGPFRTQPPAITHGERKTSQRALEALFSDPGSVYGSPAENALATPPRKPLAHPGEIGAMLDQLAAGRPVFGSPAELAALREALRQNDERMAGIKRQRDMAALLMLMMEM